MRKRKLILALHIISLASAASDYGFTNRNAHNPAGHFRESDPLARAFVTHGDALRVGYFVGTELLTFGFERYLRKHGSAGNRAADFVLTQQIIDNSVNAARSAEGYKK